MFKSRSLEFVSVLKLILEFFFLFFFFVKNDYLYTYINKASLSYKNWNKMFEGAGQILSNLKVYKALVMHF